MKVTSYTTYVLHTTREDRERIRKIAYFTIHNSKNIKIKDFSKKCFDFLTSRLHDFELNSTEKDSFLEMLEWSRTTKGSPGIAKEFYDDVIGALQ